MYLVVTGRFGGPFSRGDEASFHRGDEHVTAHGVRHISTWTDHHKDKHTTVLECNSAVMNGTVIEEVNGMGRVDL